MKVLLTGATGFLGKKVLDLLLRDERIERIDVITRKQRRHSHPKVQVFQLDLAEPSAAAYLHSDFDVVIHLAGLYDFTESFAKNYCDNVLATVNLVQKVSEVNRARQVPLIFASTYAVGYGSHGVLKDEPLEQLPSKRVPYAYTKALAERVVLDSGIPSLVFRLGVLTGDQFTGEIEKLDGPYAYLKAFERLAALPLSRHLPLFLLPVNPAGVLPLVPVDCAAAAFHQALNRLDLCRTGGRIFGVYHSDSVNLGVFCTEVLRHFFPKARPVFLDGVPEFLFKAQQPLTRIPEHAMKFATRPVRLETGGFAQEFPQCAIPSFAVYREAFFKGFHAFSRGVV